VAELAPVVVGTPAGLQLAVLSGGVRMPAIPVVETTQSPVVFTTPLVVPVAVAPVPYVAPVYPRKQDRN
jgi:hypothetical protein